MTADGAFGIQFIILGVPVSWSSIGTDLNVIVAVLYFLASADAADGAKDHPSKFW